MTISIEIGKFKAEINYTSIFEKRSREVELDVVWHSCGVYDVSYYRPHDATNHEVLMAEDWYPPNVHISFTPEQFNKVLELYPSAPKQERDQCYKPFYEDYDINRGMFDFAHDTLFQAFKDPHFDRVYMVKHSFIHGTPTPSVSVLGLSWESFKQLRDLLCNKKNEIYSGCQISMPSKTLSDLAACLPSP